MVKLGYKLMTEEHGPADLVRNAKPHDRAGHRGHQAEVLGRLGDRAQHRPGERRMALFFEPGEVVVGDGREVEARPFGP